MTGLRLMPLTVLALLMLIAAVESKKFTRCALARELKRQGFPRSQLRNWVCLVEAESSRNTRAINKNTNGSKDYGLFQINDKYWCSHGKPGNDCNLKCSDLLKNDITVASRCAKVIYKRHKFYAWYGWKNHCRKRLPNISMCKV